jgi:hypothetical protein
MFVIIKRTNRLKAGEEFAKYRLSDTLRDVQYT